MAFPFSYSLFFFTLNLGVIITISSSSWFGAWVGLELNMMSFIPLIALKMNSNFSEASLKYFLIQALGSALLISSSFLSFVLPLSSYILILLALLLKLASAPFHFWFPQVISGLMWFQILLLSTVQKLAPMILISYLMLSDFLIKLTIFSAILSALVGALGGLNLLFLPKIIAFSSINHMSWMLIAITISDMFWLIYFVFYFLILLSITSLFQTLQNFTLSESIKTSQKNSFLSILITLNFFSLGGLPPFTGFLPKWMIIQIMMNLNLFIPLFFLLLSALVTLYYYLRIMIPFLLLSNSTMTFNFKSKPPMLKSLSLFLKMSFNFLGMIFPLYFIFI
uniref:NADH-ubiquinone oxidoreductase chain 2 n=1 Tax=Xenograpsus ngatama TaxID=571435 RepID=A0A343J8I1_9EUCA|nr:NADH dehydrogenase subunit 2 [Xenograpsus ngatama]ASW34557.1 NADH dehydrogenase subunit 2 [Xenograpsus ngatama]